MGGSIGFKSSLSYFPKCGAVGDVGSSNPGYKWVVIKQLKYLKISVISAFHMRHYLK